MFTVITRFAPSPTGFLHIGNIRTAFFSWLYSRKNNGKFILRIEDTDINRSNKNYSDYIFYILEWLGLYWDEGPIFQSNRLSFYKEIINKMLIKGLAYKCFCSKERINRLRYICKKKKIKPIYDRFCRNKDFFSKKNKCYVIRFKNNIKGKIFFNDIIYGKISINNYELDDFVIQRSNGIPTYNFCVSVDDYYMNITHVIRGNEHINNTPKQINILNSLNYKLPFYAHLPIILDKNKKKLSKRNINSNIFNYINNGFLPESILNYIIRLGWSYGNKEIFNINEMKYLFNLKDINKSPCIINIDKLK